MLSRREVFFFGLERPRERFLVGTVVERVLTPFLLEVALAGAAALALVLAEGLAVGLVVDAGGGVFFLLEAPERPLWEEFKE